MAKEKIREHIGVGRRKTAVASVHMRKGKGAILVNDRPFNEYFTTEIQQKIVLSPFEKLSLMQKFDLIIRVKGGGVEAQAVAARLGISRAILKDDETQKASLKELGFLTRDPRRKERKKYGLAGARKRFQFSKR